MRKTESYTRVTLWVNRLIFALVILLLPALPFLLRWYCTYTRLPMSTFYVLIIGFYCCAVFILSALYAMEHLLRNILDAQIFTSSNVRFLHRIKRCCGMISLICLPAAIFYPPLWFMVIIMAFLFLVIWVVAQVMDAAVAIREENDLTI